jgi:hypothetical protein
MGGDVSEPPLVVPVTVTEGKGIGGPVPGARTPDEPGGAVVCRAHKDRTDIVSTTMVLEQRFMRQEKHFAGQAGFSDATIR